MPHKEHMYTEEQKKAWVQAWQDDPSQIGVTRFSQKEKISESFLRRIIAKYGDKSKRLPGDGWKTPDGRKYRPMAYDQEFRARALKAISKAKKEENCSLQKALELVSDVIGVHPSTLREWWLRAEKAATPSAKVNGKTAVATVHMAHEAEHPGPDLHIDTDPLKSRLVIQGYVISNVPEPVVLYVQHLEAELNRLRGDKEIGIQFATMLAKDREAR